jgi:hypothetical protein
VQRRVAVLAVILLGTSLLAAGCLPLIYEEERDLSDFDRFELEDLCEGFGYEIERETDGQHSFRVYFQYEFWKGRQLSAHEVTQIRDASSKVVVQTGFFESWISPNYSCSRTAWWDDLEVSDTNAPQGGYGYNMSSKKMRSLIELLDTFADAF